METFLAINRIVNNRMKPYGYDFNKLSKRLLVEILLYPIPHTSVNKTYRKQIIG